MATQPIASARLRHPAPPVPPGRGPSKGRYWALAASVLSLIPPFSLPGLVSALLASLRPARTTFAVAGTVGLVAALLALRGSPGGPTGLVELAPVVAQVAVALVLVWLARGEPEAAGIADDLGEPTLAVLAGLLTLELAGLTLRLPSPLPLTELHVWARYDGGVAAVLFGMAALALARRPRRRGFASVATLLAALCLGIGSGAFRDHLGDDPLRVEGGEGGPPITVVEPRLLETRWVNSPVTDLRLGPAGRRLAAATAPVPGGPASGGPRHGFLVDGGDGPPRFVKALDLAFLDGDRVVLLVKGPRQGLRVRAVGSDLRQGVAPEIALPPLVDPRLEVEFRRGGWTVTGIRGNGTTGLRLSGTLGERGYSETIWPARGPGPARLEQLSVGQAPRALAIATRYREAVRPPTARLLALAGDGPAVSELVLLDASGGLPLARTTTRVRCRAVLRYSGFLCVATDDEPTSRLWMVDAVSGQLDFIARLPGAYDESVVVSGARVFLNGLDRPPALVDLSTRQVWALDLGADVPDRRAVERTGPPRRGLTSPAFAASGEARYQAVALRGDLLAFSTVEGAGSRIRIFRLPRH